MGFMQNIVQKHREKVRERDEHCNKLFLQVENALSDAKTPFVNSQSFVDPQFESQWMDRNRNVLDDVEPNKIAHLRKATQYKSLMARQKELRDFVQAMPAEIHNHNERVAAAMVPVAYSIVGEVEGRKLDQQQMVCVVKEAHNHLVIAGAGTGKTTTVVGRVKYLLKTGKCQPQDILVLSFTNASASEMSGRISAETGCPIAASTFHKLGLDIITRTDGIRPRVTQISMKKFIKEQIELNMKSDDYLHMLSSYLLFHRVVAKSEFDFHSKEEYDEYLRLNPPVTVGNEAVKSYGEMDIANFLRQNGIRYIYEHPYEVDTRTKEYGQYYPDFFLPDYGIYIEYFGINRNCEVPSYFKAPNGQSATKAYRDSMEWKRKLHREHQTTMIECYAYEKLEGNLLVALKEKLEAAAVTLKPKSPAELWAEVSFEEKSPLAGLVELFETLISLIKSNGYEMATVRRLAGTGIHARVNNMLLSLLEPILDAYGHYLSENGEIDFNDMINRATDYVKQGKFINPYRYVIVDEYQDISKARFGLLYSLRESRDYDLFCVGDDWQSIYRFAGSDIGYILNFSKFWGATEVSMIETTYRFSQKLIEITSGFVMQNPLQIRKSIRGLSPDSGFPVGEVSGYSNRYAIEFMANRMKDIPRGSSVFFIGRYSFDIDLLNEGCLFTYRYNNAEKKVEVKMNSRPDLKIEFLTAHKSKGLQADYVFIINNRKSRMGFPSKIMDAPILSLLLDNCDQYPNAEERRLFYVSLTRAKKKAFLVTVSGQESVFALELKGRYGSELKKEAFECPRCGGNLVKRSGQYGVFLGCSNYSAKGCRYTRNIPSPRK